MIPQRKTILDGELKAVSVPSKDFILDFENGCVCRTADGADSLRQAIALRMMTRSDLYDIYDSLYGLPAYHLTGGQVPLVYVEIKNRIRQTLCADDRIEDVYDFSFSVGDSALQITFYARTTEGILKGSAKI